MSILVQEIVDRSKAALDAEGDERYLFDQDFKPAIRYACEWVVSAFNDAFAQNKLSGEALKELVKVSVWQTNQFSRVAFDETTVGKKLWSILAVYPNPKTIPFQSAVPLAVPEESRFYPNLSHESSISTAKRLTLEEWNDNQKNVFMAGNVTLVGDLVDYAYLDFADYSSSSYNDPGIYEIEIRPVLKNKFVTIAYLQRPVEISLISDSVEFPESLTNIITEKTLNYISYKQGDGTNLYGITEQDVNRLVTLMR